MREVSYESHGINPTKDWLVILISAQILVILLGVFSVYLYIQIEEGKIFNVETEDVADEAKIKTTLLEKAIKDIKNKEEVTEAMRQGKGIPADPAI